MLAYAENLVLDSPPLLVLSVHDPSDVTCFSDKFWVRKDVVRHGCRHQEKENKMKKLLVSALALAIASVFLFGCKKAPEDRMMAHMEKAISILEANKADPEKAAGELSKYAADNKDDLASLKKELEEMEKKMSEEEKKKKGEEMMKKMGTIIERATKLMAENPELAKNEKVSAAFKDLFPF